MIVWRGAGILVLVVAALGFGIGSSIGGERIGGPIGLILGGVGLWFLGRRLNDPSNHKVLIDPQSGQPVLLKNTHSLFWIPMEFWGVVACLVAAVLFFTPSSSSATTNMAATQSANGFDCSNETAQVNLVKDVGTAKQNLADGHFALSQKQAQRVETIATQCISAGTSPDEFHYMHSMAAFIEAQDKMATGDSSGVSIFTDATIEAKELADNESASSDMRKLASTLVTMAHQEMKQIQSANPGQMIQAVTAPPSSN